MANLPAALQAHFQLEWFPVRDLERVTYPPDLAAVWFNLRNVCRGDRAEAEAIFQAKILPATKIFIGIDQCLAIKATSRRGFKCTSKQKNIRCPCTFSAQLLQDPHVSAYLAAPQFLARTLTSFDFVRVARQNPEIAIFQSTYMGSPHEAAILRIIKETCTPDMAENPMHWVEVQNVANDTALPSVDIHLRSCLLTCRWKDMLTRFYGEEVIKCKKFEELVCTYINPSGICSEPLLLCYLSIFAPVIMEERLILEIEQVQKDPAIPRGPYQLPPCYISGMTTFFQDQGVDQYDIDRHNQMFLEAYRLTRRRRLRRAAEEREGRPLRLTRKAFRENEQLAVDDYHLYQTAPTHDMYYGSTVRRIGWESRLNLVRTESRR
ncbi:MAG: hypothetical protein Q9212_005353 [Teloschistes hypoglaucus]